jgi:hypothetical protein
MTPKLIKKLKNFYNKNVFLLLLKLDVRARTLVGESKKQKEAGLTSLPLFAFYGFLAIRNFLRLCVSMENRIDE